MIKAASPQQINFNRHYVGLNDGVRSRNFVYFRPRKKHLYVIAEVNDPDAWVQRVEEVGLSANTAGDASIRVNVAPADLRKQQCKETVTALLHAAVERHQA